jgi:hypothetical protein
LKDDNIFKGEYHELVAKGCTDHIVSLILKKFHSRIGEYAVENDIKSLQQPLETSYDNGLLYLLSALSTYLRGHIATVFYSFCKEKGTNVKITKV